MYMVERQYSEHESRSNSRSVPLWDIVLYRKMLGTCVLFIIIVCVWRFSLTLLSRRTVAVSFAGGGVEDFTFASFVVVAIGAPTLFETALTAEVCVVSWSWFVEKTASLFS